MHAWAWGLVAAEWAIRLVMLVYVPVRRTPNAARAWLLLVFLEPLVGLVLYLVFGRTYLARQRVERQGEWIALLRAARESAPLPPAEPPALSPRFAPLPGLAERLGDFVARGGNAVQLLDDYEASVAELVAAIDAARDHVHLLFYIFEPDRTGRAVADALQRAAARGVRCRVIMDASGSRPGLRVLAPALRSAGVEVIAALPRSRGTRFDLRNHRKIAVIDATVGFVGSQNLVDAYGYKGRGLTNEELVARVRGPAVAQLQAIFLADRSMETGEMLLEPRLFAAEAAAGDVVAQALPSGPSYSMQNGQRFMVALMYAAQRELVLTTPYFVPDEPFLQALQSAALRGVEVHLVVPEAVDQRLVRLAQESFYEALLAAGVHIHLYRTRFLHAKHLCVDGEVALIGTSNFDLRSFGLNEEVSLLVYDREVAGFLRRIIGRYLDSSSPVVAEEWARRPFRRKFAQNLARLVDSLL
jgi:cardiolipin synthase A/B